MKLDEWCDDCAEYDKERHCCPRFNHVIRTTLDDVRKEAYKHGKSKGIKKGLAMAQRWIPVTERLPEEDKEVLVSVYFAGLKQTHKNGWKDDFEPSYYVDLARQYCGEWSSTTDEYKIASNRHKVIAWMPLPESYKGEQG